MNAETQTRNYFIFGSILLFALIVGGLVWAILAGPGTPTTGLEERGLRFSDDNDPAIGPGDAKVIVRIFGDFECPACRAAEEGLKYAMKTYADKVRFVWNDFPLVSIHQQANAGANAARCAEEQGKFWEYHDALYANQTEWTSTSAPTEHFIRYATQLGLKENSFTSCVASSRYQWKIQDDLKEGNSNAVRATPTFFINNVRLEGVRSTVDWDQAIQLQLANASST